MTIVHIVLILLNREGADSFTLQLVYFIYKLYELKSKTIMYIHIIVLLVAL